MATIYDLNKDVIYEIQKYLLTKELILFSRTCRILRKAFKDNLPRLSLNLSKYNTLVRVDEKIINKLTEKISNSDLKYLQEIHGINLEGCANITNNGLKYISGAMIVNLKSCNKITDMGLKYLTNNCNNNMDTVDLSFCCQISDNGLKYLKGVRIINLMGCFKLTNECLKYLESEYINLRYCDKITDNAINEFKKEHPSCKIYY